MRIGLLKERGDFLRAINEVSCHMKDNKVNDHASMDDDM